MSKAVADYRAPSRFAIIGALAQSARAWSVHPPQWLCYGGRAPALWILSLLWAAHGPEPVGAAQPPRWNESAGYRWTALDVPKGGQTGFTLLAPEQTGVQFTNTLAEEEGVANRVLWNGSGVALGDYDNDGRPDIFFCGLDTPNALYRNLGNWRFTNVTREVGLEMSGKYFRAAVFADLNGDGWVDLLVSGVGQGVWCFLNDGHGRFKDVTRSAGTASAYGSATLALADIDGNGTLDLYVANNRTSDLRDQSAQVPLFLRNGQLTVPPSLADRILIRDGRIMEYGEPDQLLLNNGQAGFLNLSWTNGAFLDENGAPLSKPPLDWGLTATFRDINGDGAPDLYVCNDFWTPDRIWINNGHGKFRALPTLALRHTSASSMGVDFADVNRDGALDFYVLDMLSRDHRSRRRQMLAQRPTMSGIGEIETRPQIMRNTLFVNRGDDTFAEIADYAGVEASDWSWSPIFVDVDLDGYEDLLISAGHAKDVQDLDANAQVQARQRSYTAITDPTERQQAFQHDKLINARFYPRLAMPVVAFRNLGNLHFEEMTSSWGTVAPGVHQGMAMADLDNDGDLDLVVNNLGSAAGIYRNNTSAPRVAVRLRGLSPNTQGIGAKVTLLNGAVPRQSQEVICGGRYLSGSEPLLVFAAGQKESMVLEVAWRRGRKSQVQDVRPNRLYEIDEASATLNRSSSVAGRPVPAGRAQAEASSGTSAIADARVPKNSERATPQEPLVSDPQPRTNRWFQDVSDLIGHKHTEQAFNDFARQPSLPRRLSQLGPGVAVGDLNGDGHEDLVIGSGQGGAMAVYYGDGKGNFQRDLSLPLSKTVARDQTGIVILGQTPQGATVLAGESGYEDSAPAPSLLQYDWPARSSSEPLPSLPSCTGPIALADIDGDGELDLFVGGRVIAGHWPEAASSQIYRKQDGQWKLDQTNTKALEKVGLVSGAVFTDVDGDGWPDLLLACEWGPVRLLRNEKGRLRDVTAAWGLGAFTGWWNGVAVGDLDGDGKPDIVASNWGLNSPYHATAQHPLRIYYGDLSGRGTVDLVEASYDPELRAWAPLWMRDMLAVTLPWIAEQYPSHKAYSEAGVESILGNRLPQAAQLEATTLASMLFLNRGDRFEGSELPTEAQLAPGFGVTVADFDGDGCDDVFLGQNFFATQAQVPRLDAGRGLLLRGDGKGKLSPVPGQESGLLIYGEQRGTAVGDFNEDGRVDLVVAQNGAATRLFLNAGARAGLRVHLRGTSSNPTAAGATVRLRFGDHLGPAREVHAGSGYWSQDSSVMVLGTPEPPIAVVVRWPGGRTSEWPIAIGASDVTVTVGGQ